jgi:hypothetical protein
MGLRPRTIRPLALLAAIVVAGVVAAAALAAVTVYKNDFSSKREARELRPAEGRHCDKRWRRKSETVRVTVKEGAGVCGYRPPVEGDTAGPDHDFRAMLRVLKDTPKALRDSAFVAIVVRSDKGSGYELRVFPSRHKFELIRRPTGGGHDFPAKGTKSAIKNVGKPNVLSLAAVGDHVTAKVNGKRMARVTDSKPSQVNGRKLEVAIGNKKRSDRAVLATIDNLKLQVPNP